MRTSPYSDIISTGYFSIIPIIILVFVFAILHNCYNIYVLPPGTEFDPLKLLLSLTPIDPSSECSDLPTPGNGTKNCTKTSFGLSCVLTCNNGFEFSGSYDVSPQTCVDGIWRYELDNKEIPDCEGLFIYCVYL